MFPEANFVAGLSKGSYVNPAYLCGSAQRPRKQPQPRVLLGRLRPQLHPSKKGKQNCLVKYIYIHIYFKQPSLPVMSEPLTRFLCLVSPHPASPCLTQLLHSGVQVHWLGGFTVLPGLVECVWKTPALPTPEEKEFTHQVFTAHLRTHQQDTEVTGSGVGHCK